MGGLIGRSERSKRWGTIDRKKRRGGSESAGMKREIEKWQAETGGGRRGR